MTLDPDLSHFVRDALQRGLSPDETRAALAQAGWADPEIDAALSGWMLVEGAGPVPRPVRSSSARDAFFYALLFIVFGAIAGNVLVLWFGQINLHFPDETDRLYAGHLDGLRWSIAALIVFLPVFWWLERADRRATSADPSLHHTGVRRWLSAVALLIAVIALLTDALFLIYRWLDGQLTLRFVLKSATVALMALIVLAYFRETRRLPLAAFPLPAGWMLSGLAVLGAALALLAIGGPAQGRAEQRDQSRIRDLYTLANDLGQCPALTPPPLPVTFDPMDCAANPTQLSVFAQEIRYTRIGDTRFRLCVEVESPETLYASAGLRVEGTSVCADRIVT